MQMLEMLYDEIKDAVDRKVPFVIPIGTLEYHARHASCGTDTLVITGCLRELEKEKEIVSKLGEKVSWDRLDSKKASVICTYLKGLDFENQENYNELMNTVIDKVVLWKSIFSKYI